MDVVVMIVFGWWVSMGFDVFAGGGVGCFYRCTFSHLGLLHGLHGTVANLAWECAFAKLVQLPLQVAIFEAIEDRPQDRSDVVEGFLAKLRPARCTYVFFFKVVDGTSKVLAQSLIDHGRQCRSVPTLKVDRDVGGREALVVMLTTVGVGLVILSCPETYELVPAWVALVV